MAAKTNIMGVGVPAAQAHLLGFDALNNVTSAGGNQAAATPLPGTCCAVAGTSGVRLPPAASSGPVILLPTAAATVYPNGTDNINALGPGAGLLLSAGKVQYLIPVNNTWYSIGSAN